MTITERKVVEMLRENTGVAMCDSGGTPKYDKDGKYIGSEYGYGRSYERNRGRKFKDEPAAVLEGGYGEISVTRNVFHFIVENATYDAKETKRFNRWAKRVDKNNHKGWLELMEAYPYWLRDDRGHEVGGLYGDGEPCTVNTYNGECILSQTLQFVLFTIDGEQKVLLQVHGGCDVRGGYTAPKIFSIEDCFLNYNDSVIVCERHDPHKGEGVLPGMKEAVEEQYERHEWRTDDGYHWYPDGICGKNHKQLETYEILKEEEEEQVAERGKDRKIHVDEDGNAYCPLCGNKLKVF